MNAVIARRAVRLLAVVSALGTAAYAACSSPGYIVATPLLWPLLIVLLFCAAFPAIYNAFESGEKVLTNLRQDTDRVCGGARLTIPKTDALIELLCR